MFVLQLRCFTTVSQARVVSCIGGVSLMRAVGFNKVDESGESKLVLNAQDVDAELLLQAKAQLEQAIAAYR
jgi:hypothetical protein